MASERQLSGKVFGEYTLGEYLGYSGIAHVYKAAKKNSDEDVAVQLLPNHFVDQPGFTEAFVYNASPLMALRHQNIISVLDCGVDNGFPYLVTQYLVGPTLQDLIDASGKRGTKIPIEACLFIIDSLGAALSHAHKIDIPHGNLQPHNVLLEKTGVVMVGDFRLYHIMIYKPRFRADEDWPEADQASILEDKRLDLSALGHIFYHVVTGRAPFESSSTLLFSRAQPRPPLVPPSELASDLPNGLEEVIVKILAQDAVDRYQSIEEIIRDLGRLKQRVKTDMLPSGQLLELARVSSRYKDSEMPSVAGPEKSGKIILFFPDNGHLLELQAGKEYTLGRKHRNQPFFPDIDLTPLKGYEWGISRMHAKLVVSPEGGTITDLNSSNGTWVSGKRIPPNASIDIKSKEIFLLGRLRLQLLLPDDTLP
jgi:serine/threonine protein kinase